MAICSCREKKDAEISSLEQERNKELEELQELEEENNRIRERVNSMAKRYNRSECQIVEYVRQCCGPGS